MDKKELVGLALKARERSYCPYSGFAVGAALLCSSGKVYLGCNVENASFGATLCAERTAAAKAVSNGEQLFISIAIMGCKQGAAPGESDFSYPCGVCRQVLREFAAPGMKVYVAQTPDDILSTTLEDLLPHSFGPEHLTGPD